MGYTINQDGTVTRDKVPSTPKSDSSSSSSGGSDNNSGCWILVIIGIIVGIIIAVSNKNSSTSSNNDYEDSVAVDTVAADTVVADDYYEADTVTTDYENSSSSLDVSESSISLGWEEQTYTISVYSSSSWWIDVGTANWITLDCEGTSITLSVASNPEEGSRKDYFIIKNNDGLTKRVNIYQE